MGGLNKISAWVLAIGLLTIPAFGQRGGRGGSPQRQGGQQHRMQGPHFGDWLRKNLNTPPEQQQKALESDPKFQKLPPERQERLKQRLQQFNSLPPEQQQRILDRMEKWEHMTPEQHQQARQLFDRMRALPADRRESIRQQIRALNGMTMEQRVKYMNSDQYKKQFNNDERDIMQKWLDLRDNDTETATPRLDDPQK
jgi:DNA-directed RNA polymerase subunit F